MKAKELQATLDALEINQQSAARRLGIHPRTMRRYLNGEAEVPGLVASAVHGWRMHGAPADPLGDAARPIGETKRRRKPRAPRAKKAATPNA